MRSKIKSLFIFFISIIFFTNISAQTASLEATLSLQDVNGVKVPYQNGFPLPSFEKQNRTTIDLSGNWRKQRFDASNTITLMKRDVPGIAVLENEAAGRHLPNYDDSGWGNKFLPSVENNLNTAPTPPEIIQDSEDGVWYRRNIEVDASLSGKFVKLIFYAANYITDVWLNGKYLGYHEGGHTPFAFDVGSFLNYGGSNLISIRVHNIAWGSTKSIVPYNTPDWFNYSGIYHDVYIEISDPVSIIRANIVPKDLDGNIETAVIFYNKKGQPTNVTAKINVYEADVNENNIKAESAHELIGTEVTLSGTAENNLSINSIDASVWKTNLKISNPKVWTPKTPNLYVMKVTLTYNGNVIDEFHTQFGIRTVATKGDKFLLNNRIVFLTGAARHEEHPDYGRAVPKDIIYSDLITTKNLNINFLRTAHYPNNLFTYLVADRIGLTIMEEIPVFWFDTADAWQHQEQRRITYQMFREMVFKDFNRPSIILWSTSNECLDVTNRAIYNQNIVNDQRTNYYDGRLISQSAAADRPGPSDASQTPLDVAGWTMYFGIFHPFNGRVRFNEAFGGTFDFLNKARIANSTKPIIDTEFGYWSSESAAGYQDQVYIFNETFRAFKIFAAVNSQNQENTALGALMASTWWCVFDWYQFKISGYQTMGLITMDRQFYKPVANELKNNYLPYFNIEGVLTSAENESPELPSSFHLEQNYPNPFNPSTTIQLSIPLTGLYKLKVYDVLGQEVVTLLDGELYTGQHKINFNASKLASGIYLYRLFGENLHIVKKMVLIR